MNTLKSIEYKDGSHFACDASGRGLFVQEVSSWRQISGLLDTPRFRSADHFSRYVRSTMRDSNGEPLPRRVAAYGWAS